MRPTADRIVAVPQLVGVLQHHLLLVVRGVAVGRAWRYDVVAGDIRRRGGPEVLKHVPLVLVDALELC